MSNIPNQDELVNSEKPKMVERAEIADKAREHLSKMVAEGSLKLDVDESKDIRAFVAPIERQTRFLVKPGKVRQVKDNNSVMGERDVARDGDIFVEFNDGICVLDASNPEDAIRIAWCEAHDAICRDVSDPFTEAWALIKELTTPSARNESRLPAGMDVEAVLRGDPAGIMGTHSATRRAKQQAAQAREG